MGIDERTRTAPAPASIPRPSRYPMLWIAHHPRREWMGRYRPLEEGAELILGRGQPEVFGGAWREDDLASRRHLALRREGAVIRIEDLDSHNGSWLDGARVRQGVLSDGQCLRIGRVVLLLRWAPLPSAPAFEADGWVGVGPDHCALLESVQLVAPRDTTVLITGETGVGKDCVARAVHARSGRTGALVSVNCAGLADSVLQSEIFGHVRGAFTGAQGARDGLVLAARGGTLFLDEIGDASPNLQAALLRLLQSGEYRPVGSDRVRRANIRVVAATHRDLARRVREGAFREDLWGRLSQWTLGIKPLRERPEDLAALVPHFAGGRATTAALMEQLLRHPWPGNVRELRATLARLCALTPEPAPLDVAPWLETADAARGPEAGRPARRRRRPRLGAEELDALLRAHRGNIRASAAELGIGRNTLYAWLRAAGLAPESYR